MATQSGTKSQNEKTISKIILEKVAKQKMDKAKNYAADAQKQIL